MIERIVSLTPSITETIFALGAGRRVVGITDSCDFPPEVRAKPHVCSWFDPDMDRILDLEPDLVLGLATAHQRLVPVFKRTAFGWNCLIQPPWRTHLPT